MRILFVTNLYPPQVFGGYEILCAQVVRRFRDRGHETLVLTSEPSTDSVAQRCDEPDVYRQLALEVPFGQPFSSSRWRRYAVGRRNEEVTAAVLGSVNPDLVFLWSLRRATLGPARAAEKSGIPVAWTLNDEYLAGFKAVDFESTPRRFLGAASDRSWARSDTLHGVRLEHTTAISRCLRDRLVGGGVPVAAAEVLYQGVPAERFRRRSTPIDSVEKCIYVGQLHPDKGVHVAIDAIHQVAANSAVSLTIVGTGDPAYERYLRDLAARGPATIDFLGKQPHGHLPAVYRAHDALLFPSVWAEPFGLTHLEAMACGLPVVSTGHGGQGEVLRDGGNALVVPRADAAAMAAAVDRLVANPGLARRLAEAGHRLVHEELNLERYVERLNSWLEGVRALSDRPMEEAA